MNVVTGGTGFVGRHLVGRLMANGEKVLAVVRPTSRIPAAWHNKVDVRVVRDFKRDTLLREFQEEKIDTIFNLAAYGVAPTARDMDGMIEANAALPPRMVDIAAEVGALMVHTGSFSEYAAEADSSIRQCEQAPLEMTRIYGSTKAAGSLMASAAAHAASVKLRVLRLYKVYGPDEEPHRLLPSLIRSLSRRSRVALSEGTQVRDFLHVDDAVDAMLAARAHARLPNSPGVAILNVCTGQGHSVREFAETTARIMDAPPSLLGFGEIPMRADDRPIQVGDPGLMEQLIGWRARHSLDTGIADSVRRSRLGLHH